MKIHHLFWGICLCFSTNILFAQNYQKTSSGIKTTVNAVDIEIQFFAPAVARVIKSPEGVAYEKQSLSVIAKPEKVNFKADMQDNKIVLNTSELSVSVDTGTGIVSYCSKDGKSLLAEKSGMQFIDFDDAGTKTYQVYQPFVLDKEEAIYGLGQLQNGKMIQRNMTKNLIQGNVEDVSPFFQSTKGYGVFWDNYSPTLFTDNEVETSFRSEVGDCVDYYFMYGKNADGVIAQVRNLTGQAPMFPLWTYGYWQSKERYKSQEEVVDVVRKYRELGIPLDGIIQDWQYWGHNYLWNAMDFQNPTFNNPQKMMEDVHAMNAHMAISIWSSFGPMTKPYRELDKKGMLFNFTTWPQSGLESWPPNMEYPSGVRVYDAYNPEARDIYWKYLNKGIFSYIGNDDWWLDSTETDHINRQESDYDLPTHLGSYRSVKNVYSLMHNSGIASHQKALSKDKRVIILTRSGFIGQQRYGCNTWSSDVTSTWDMLEKQIPAALNYTLMGIPNWNSDIGGFFAGRWNQEGGAKNPKYQELYVRWMQFGTFCPMMRSHGTELPREIWNFGKRGEWCFDAQEKVINLRYRLLPYIYSTSWDVSHNDGTFMRPLVMDFAPVYLPQGADWWDFWSNEKQQDRQTLNRSVSWEDKARPLTIEERESSFPNMLKSRKFKVVLVGQNSGTGDRPMKGGKTISYAGKKKSIKL